MTKLSDMMKRPNVPQKALGDMLKTAKAGKPQVIDPNGSGMSAQEIAQLMQRAGNGR